MGVSPFGSSRESVLDLARTAADGGLDGLILGDGFVSTPSFPVWSGGVDCVSASLWIGSAIAASLPGAGAPLPASGWPDVDSRPSGVLYGEESDEDAQAACGRT